MSGSPASTTISSLLQICDERKRDVRAAGGVDATPALVRGQSGFDDKSAAAPNVFANLALGICRFGVTGASFREDDIDYHQAGADVLDAHESEVITELADAIWGIVVLQGLFDPGRVASDG
ncbi:hypothetical protein [Microvirga rosea]|uniref:hypothetical protein n=1 Tax=Microvirga rosea TaxID=2715425 RepID=UPI001D09BE14|nr:hypothetical protein [Microvirga rosea]MCB8822896.1 hypothetical protein [Microvirga rosea]